MKLHLYVALLLLFSMQTVAQTAEDKLAFKSINSIGLLTGGRGEASSLQTVGGLHIKKWFAGIGIGLDYYETRTIPLFIDLRRNLLQKQKTPFLYVDAGTNFIWKKSIDTYYQPTRSRPQLFYDAGIGYKIPVKNKTAFIFSAGYSVKKIKQTINSYYWLPTPVGESEYN